MIVGKSITLYILGGNTCAIPIKSLVSAGRVILKAIDGHQPNIEFLLLSNRVSVLIEILKDQLTILVPEPGSGLDLDFTLGKYCCCLPMFY